MERWYLLITEKFLFWTFRWWEIRSFLSQEVDGKDDIYWLLKSSCFELFGGGKYGLFLSQEVDGKMIFTGYWEVLVLNFSVIGNTVFFESRSWWKDDIYWLTRSSCFELFSDVNTIFFSAKKLMGRWYLLGLFELSMIFQDLGNTVFRAVNKTINYLPCQNNSSCIRTNYKSAWPN